MTNGTTDVLVWARDLYERTLAVSVSQEYKSKLQFVNCHPLLRSWEPRLRAYLAESIEKEEYIYNETLVRQGETDDAMFFIQRQVK